MATKRLFILLDRDDLAVAEHALAGDPSVPHPTAAARLKGGAPAAPPPAAFFPDDTILAFDVDLHIHLLEAGVAHLTPWDLVAHDEYDAIRLFEADIWRFWTAHTHVWYDGLDLLQILPYRHTMCLGRLAWVAWVIRRAFERLAPDEVVTFHESVGHGLDQPPGRDKMPLLAAVARGMAEQAGIPTRVLRRGTDDGASGFVDWTARGGERELAPVNAKKLLAGRPYVLFPASDPDLARQLPLVRRLMDETDLAVVQLYKSADDATLAAMSQVGHFAWHESQVAGDVPAVEDMAFAQAGRQAFDRARRGLASPLRAVFDNPYVDIHFDFVFGEYARKLAWHVRAWRPFLRENPPAVVVANYPTPIWEIAGDLGIPRVAMSHGLMLMGNAAWFAAFGNCTIGAMSTKHAAKLVAAGVPSARVVVTGDPRLDALTDALKPAFRPASHDNPSVEAAPHTSREERRILLVTGSLGVAAKLDGLPKYDWKSAVACFEEIGRMALRRPYWRFAVKIHPRYDHPGLYERVNCMLPEERRFRVYADEPLEKLAAAADVVVACNVVTSALIEASLHGIPVLQLRAAMCWYDEKAWGLDRWRHVDSVAALEAELEALLANPTERARGVADTRAALEDFLGGKPQSATRRCVEVIRGVGRGEARRKEGT